jgi:hypothetical protein
MEPVPDPAGEHLAGRILETGDLVEVVVVETLEDGLHGAGEVSEVPDPSTVGVDGSLDMNRHPEGMPMQAGAFVTRRNVGQPVGGLEREFLEKFQRR